MNINMRQLLYGLSTYLPGLSRFHAQGTGGTDSARYCYSAWMRHLIMAYHNGLCADIPKSVGELGPGDSIGIGLAALLSGADLYYGMDVIEHASLSKNIKIFDEMVDLFRAKANVPDEQEFKNLKPALDSYRFPAYLLTDQKMKICLSEMRIKKIRQSIQNYTQIDSMIKYASPWSRNAVIHKGSLDMVYSQAVLEHIDELSEAYESMYLWLKPGGFISHQIDFKSHGLTATWDGHWGVSDFTWKLLRGRRAYLLNRQPYSVHIKKAKEAGFKIVYEKKVKSESTISRDKFSECSKKMTADDLIISGLFMQAINK